jgi:hypothetical protein
VQTRSSTCTLPWKREDVNALPHGCLSLSFFAPRGCEHVPPRCCALSSPTRGPKWQDQGTLRLPTHARIPQPKPQTKITMSVFETSQGEMRAIGHSPNVRQRLRCRCSRRATEKCAQLATARTPDKDYDVGVRDGPTAQGLGPDFRVTKPRKRWNPVGTTRCGPLALKKHQNPSPKS